MSGINGEGMAQIAGLVAALTRRLADGYDLPFAPPRRPEEGLVRTLPGDDPSTIEKIVEPDGRTR